MAQLIIDIPDAQIARVRDAFATRYGWTGTHPTTGLPETKTAFAKRIVAAWIRDEVRNEEIRQAQIAAANLVTPVDPS